MAVTTPAVGGVAKISENSISVIQTDDGLGAGANIIDNASLIAALVSVGINSGPLWDLVHLDTNPNSTAAQQRLLLGDAAGIAPADRDMRDIPHCTVTIVQLTGLPGAQGWIVDADTDAAAVLRGELNVVGPDAAGTTASDALLTITAVNSYKH